MQSWEWGAVREAEGKAVVRFVVPLTNSSQSMSRDLVFQMTIHPIPYTTYSIGYIPKSAWPPTEFLQYLKSYCLKQRILFVKFEPNELETKKLKFEIPNVVSSSHPLFTPWNQVLDISQSEDVLLGAMHPKTRYNIKLAAKKGVTVSEMNTDEGYAIFEKLYFDTTKRQGYRGHLPAYHKNIWEHLKVESQTSKVGRLDSVVIPANAGILPESPHLTTDCSKLEARLLIATYQGEPLAAFQVWHFKDTIYYTYGGSSEKHRNFMAANLLMWETVRLGRSLGANTLDMWGSLPPNHDDTDPWAGFTRFKSGYGTKFVQYVGSYDLVAHSFLYHLYTLAQTLRAKML